MQLTPVYGDRPALTADPLVADPGGPLLRQRERLAALLTGLDAEQWAAPSRCEGWSVQDVVTHLNTTNGFWAVSIGAGLAGDPTRFLATFDPVASPARMVETAESTPMEETLRQFVESTAALAEVVAAVGDRWDVLGEAPPGHVPMALVAQHALWDSWIHERDIVLPLGIEPVEEPDEIEMSLRYAAGLSPAFAVSRGAVGTASIEFHVTAPDLRFSVHVDEQVVVREAGTGHDPIVIAGDAVALLEALSMRAPFPDSVRPEDRPLLDGLAVVFDQQPLDSPESSSLT